VAVVLADLGVEGADVRFVQYQVVAFVLADGEALVRQPDGFLAVVREVNADLLPRINRRCDSTNA
jgi:hypothetical protein